MNLDTQALEREYLDAAIQKATNGGMDLPSLEVELTTEGANTIRRKLRELVEKGAPVTMATLRAELRGKSDAERLLVDVVTAGGIDAALPDYVKRLRDLSYQREIWSATQNAQAKLAEGDAAGAEAELRGVIDNRTAIETSPDADVHAFLAEPESEFDWLVPLLIEQRDRVVLTGIEGGGKSTFLRQFAVQVAAGIHPFTLEEIEPARVLLVDLENSRRHVRRQMSPLVIAARQAGRTIEPDVLFPVIRPEGIDLARAHDSVWLHERCAATRPQLLCIGPSYKMSGSSGSERSWDEEARVVTTALDVVREKYGCAVILEAHQPHAHNGGARPTRPIGSSIWLRWPEFGLGLGSDGLLSMWRGPREDRAWPIRLARGGPWPWSPTTDNDVGDRVAEVIRAHLKSGGDHGVNAVRRAVRSADLKVRNDYIDEIRAEVFSEGES